MVIYLDFQILITTDCSVSFGFCRCYRKSYVKYFSIRCLFFRPILAEKIPSGVGYGHPGFSADGSKRPHLCSRPDGNRRIRQIPGCQFSSSAEVRQIPWKPLQFFMIRNFLARILFIVSHIHPRISPNDSSLRSFQCQQSAVVCRIRPGRWRI